MRLLLVYSNCGPIDPREAEGGSETRFDLRREVKGAGIREMRVLVVGASGATGRLLVKELLGRGMFVLAFVRSAERFAGMVEAHDRLKVEQASPLELSEELLFQHVDGCDAVVSCLGHSLSFKGIYGKPRQLVTEAAQRLCGAAKARKTGLPVKFLLMNSTGCRNYDIGEKISFLERYVVALIRLLVPPHRDNEGASHYLRRVLGANSEKVEWVIVRPDSLVDKDKVSEYRLHESPTRSAIFDSGKTSRINVAHFMASLLSEEELWELWKGRTPVLYDSE